MCTLFKTNLKRKKTIYAWCQDHKMHAFELTLLIVWSLVCISFAQEKYAVRQERNTKLIRRTCFKDLFYIFFLDIFCLLPNVYQIVDGDSTAHHLKCAYN